MCGGRAEVIDPNLRRLVCTVASDNPEKVDGLGLIVGVKAGDSTDRGQRVVYVLTAGHILGTRDKAPVGFGAASPVTCTRMEGRYSDTASAQNDNTRDWALLECRVDKRAAGGIVFDVLAPASEWKKGEPLQLLRNDFRQVVELAAGLSLRDDVDGLRYNNLFGMPLAGASGGPLIENRNRVAAMCLQEIEAADPKVERTTGLATPLADLVTALPPGVFQLRNRSRNAPFQQPGQFEIAADSAMIFAAKLGFVNAAPRFRLSTPLPFRRHFSARFDFFTVGRTTEITDTRFTGFNSHLEAALGPRLGWLRRSNVLGGLYTSAGAAVLKSRVRRPGLRIDQTRLTPSWEVGWRYRLPRRSWGLAASYQRMWMRGPADVRRELPNLQGFQAGVFAVLGQ